MIRHRDDERYSQGYRIGELEKGMEHMAERIRHIEATASAVPELDKRLTLVEDNLSDIRLSVKQLAQTNETELGAIRKTLEGIKDDCKKPDKHDTDIIESYKKFKQTIIGVIGTAVGGGLLYAIINFIPK